MAFMLKTLSNNHSLTAYEDSKVSHHAVLNFPNHQVVAKSEQVS